MIAAALVFAALAALLHVYIFVMESLTWTTPRTRKVFGTSAEEAETTKLLAFNQGFYNLFLAIGIVAGLLLVAGGSVDAGRAIVLFACGCMVGAGLVLVTSNRAFARAAAMQAVPPALAIVLALVL
jgi:putative membrane protein